MGTLFHVEFTSWPEIRACLLFFRNYTGPLVGNRAQHFWSLSLEEQFYLVWPAVLVVVGVRRSRWIAGGCAIAVALWRFIFWADYNGFPNYMRTEVRADAIFVGCLLALFLSEERFRETARYTAKRLALPALAILVFCIARFTFLPPLFENLAIAVLLCASVCTKQIQRQARCSRRSMPK